MKLFYKYALDLFKTNATKMTEEIYYFYLNTVYFFNFISMLDAMSLDFYN